MILAVDTSSSECSIALSDVRGNVLFAQSHIIGRGHDRHLFHLIEEALEQSKTHRRELTRLIAIIGPGSFTGLRVGIAAAQAISLGLNIEGIGVTAFDAMCAENENVRLIPTMTGQFYTASRPPTVQTFSYAVMSPLDIKQTHQEKSTLTFACCNLEPLLEENGIPYRVRPICAQNALIAYVKNAATPQPLLPLYIKEPTPTTKLASLHASAPPHC